MLTAFLKQLSLQRFVAFDLETTGLETECEIIEIGALRFENGEVVERFSELVHPETPIPPRIEKLTGISQSMVQKAPSIGTVLPAFLEFLGDDPLVAHNMSFDLGMLTNWVQRLGLAWTAPKVQADTVPLAQIMLPAAPAHRLGELAGLLDLGLENAHRASDDAEATGHLLLRLLRIALGLPMDMRHSLALLSGGTNGFLDHCFSALKELGTQESGPLDWDKFQPFLRDNILLKNADPSTTSEEPALETWFQDEGHLSKGLENFVHRPQQLQMASAVQTCFQDATPEARKRLVVEAGTGTGKSLAYLLPAILKGRELVREGRRGVVLSTNTKNLQDQLFNKDLPLLSPLLTGPLKALILKGRGNYICGNRYRHLLDEARERFTDEDRLRLMPLVLWSAMTRSGDIEECTGFRSYQHPALWSRLRSESGSCSNRTCFKTDDCWASRARREAAEAHLVIVNHSLLLADLEVDHGILGEFSHLVLDEGHNLVRNAERYLRQSFSFPFLQNTLKGLYDKDGRGRGLLKQLRVRIMASRMSETSRDPLIQLLQDLAEALASFQDPLTTYHEGLNDAQWQRHGAALESQKYTQKERFKAESNPLNVHYQLHRDLFGALPTVQIALSKLQKEIDELDPLVQEDLAALPAELKQLGQDLLSHCKLLDQIADVTDENEKVYWSELNPRNRESSFHVCPLDLGSSLAQKLWSDLESIVMTSATLAIDKQFDWILTETGIGASGGDVQCMALDSPFDYARQMRSFIPAWFPDSSPRNQRDFVADLADLIANISETFDRGTLLLFTSYGMLRQVYMALVDRLDYHKTPLLAQGMDGSRHDILAKFKNAENAVLLGTDSFWEGVDVPGKALQLLVVTKLPFAVPSEPMVQARREAIESRGGNAFMEQSVPEAVIRFRQGIGRLIRHEKDRGVLLIADKRVVQKRYGEIFADAVPVETKQSFQGGDLRKSLNNFWR